MKRRLLAAAVFVLAGSVVNVAAAWGCLAWSPTDADVLGRAARHDHRWWQHHAPTGFDGTPNDVSRCEGFGVAATTRGAVEIHRVQRAGTLHVIPRWVVAQEIRVGWPFRTVSGERWTRSDAMMGMPVAENKTVYRWSRSLGPAVLSRSDAQQWQLLPLRPLVIGFALNAIAYAVILFLLVGGVFALRRHGRRKRGLCPACAYPRGESGVCSECGQSLAGRTKVAT